MGFGRSKWGSGKGCFSSDRGCPLRYSRQKTSHMIKYRKIPGDIRLVKEEAFMKVVGQGLNRVDAYGK